MNPALWISKTGLDAQQTNISVTSNNLANASTWATRRRGPSSRICFIRTSTSLAVAPRRTPSSLPA
jgi:flagellar basal body rod protein FlgG